jgi:hypothetical protein
LRLKTGSGFVSLCATQVAEATVLLAGSEPKFPSRLSMIFDNKMTDKTNLVRSERSWAGITWVNKAVSGRELICSASRWHATCPFDLKLRAKDWFSQ